ncbi:synaptic vesicle glycoprotein 2C-like isoform X2 [Aethina tumida]|uniref:synaptic vesicle glycoprotein 2C-like isoform X2 n=1 Tax=Aethina tumida TaxID=116153 RepID=UPI00214732B2|nr:synaptic vesicle glycoprotein 2C-like isoform X2 [Aethina tumida]
MLSSDYFRPFSQWISSVADYVEKAQSADFETAIHYAKYGKFQRVLILVCGMIYATCAISTTTLSFVLPSAECDFNLSSADKGKLSAMPLIGMIFGCGIWGSIADSRGRKLAITLSLLIDFLAGLGSSIAQNYNLFLICRFFNGFGIIGATSIIFSYLGEFLSKKDTDKALGKLEIFWNIGVILLPGVAWSLLRKSVLDSFKSYGNFSPWRIFVSVCSLPSLLSLCMLFFLPETPKYLISKGKYEEARHVFQRIFRINTGQSFAQYPVLALEGEYENNNNVQEVTCSLRTHIFNKMSEFGKTIKSLFGHTYVRYLGIVSFADFGLMASYYTLIMWFPEIFERFSEFESKYPNKTSTVCTVSESSSKNTSIYYYQECDPIIGDKVFVETFIIALSCMPTSISLGYLMEKLGKKIVLVSSLILSGCATVSLIWVQSTNHTLIVSCVFEALTSILEAVLFCVVVDIFPTNIRAIALSITATSGRIGAIFGNVIFGLLIDLNCVIPIYLFGFMLIGSGLLCITIPRTENYLTLY